MEPQKDFNSSKQPAATKAAILRDFLIQNGSDKITADQFFKLMDEHRIKLNSADSAILEARFSSSSQKQLSLKSIMKQL